MLTKLFRGLLAGAFLFCPPLVMAQAEPALDERHILLKALLSEDVDEQIRLVQKLQGAEDPMVEQALAAWRQGGVFIYETNGVKTPFLLDPKVEADSKSAAIRIEDGKPLQDEQKKPIRFLAADLTPVDTTSKLRIVIKDDLDLITLSNPDPKVRQAAVNKLGLDQNKSNLRFFQARMEKEKNVKVRRALDEAIAITELADPDANVEAGAARKLGEMRSIAAVDQLRGLVKDTAKKPKEVVQAARISVKQIEEYMFKGMLVGTAFRGLSLAAVLLVITLGLAITFGLMGVINMAHGEIMTVGAYSAYVTQNYFIKWFGSGGRGFEFYFPVALVVGFVAAALAGLLLERLVVRFLYKRPLESLLATWGVSLVLQQVFRSEFGPNNVDVTSPRWLSGSFDVNDVSFAYNRIFVIGFAVFVMALTYFILNRTTLGLQVRAVMQNRHMAACIGVRTERVNMMTFALGSGLAGLAGVCLSQLANVGPSVGQNYIVDSFMVVVLGGVGNLVGTITAALGIGVVDEMLQPFFGAVLGKIMVLSAIILFLQWRPSGIFVTRSRSLEG